MSLPQIFDKTLKCLPGENDVAYFTHNEEKRWSMLLNLFSSSQTF